MTATLTHAGVEIKPLSDGRFELTLEDRETGRRVTRTCERADFAYWASVLGVRSGTPGGQVDVRFDVLTALTLRSEAA